MVCLSEIKLNTARGISMREGGREGGGRRSEDSREGKVRLGKGKNSI